jgi:hypothetical protein
MLHPPEQTGNALPLHAHAADGAGIYDEEVSGERW